MKKENLSSGKQAVIERSRQLTEFVWTPLRDITVYTKTAGKTKLPQGEKVKGMIYSSTEPTDKFIFENISFETFATIVNNPDSALYTKDLNGHNNSWAYFGIVCNGLARYALNINRRYSTKRWLDVPGMHKIFEHGKYTVDDMEICDVLLAYGEGRNHVALVTDLVYNEEGKVTGVEVSEAIRPVCVRRLFTPEEYYEKFNLFAICRYDYIDSVPFPDQEDSAFISKELIAKIPDIALDYGNKTNYRTYEDVVISAFLDGENEIEIRKGEELIEKFTINGKGNVARKFERGYYTVTLVNTGTVLEFCVTEPEISHSVKDGVITVRVNPNDDESCISHLELREKTRLAEGADPQKLADETVNFYNPCCASLAKLFELTDEEKKTGVFSREIPNDAFNFKVVFKNKYGMWTHTMIEI